MALYLLSKIVFFVEDHPAALLGGLTSNALEAPRNAFLNQHGRIIALFDQVKISERCQILIVEADFAQAVETHLARYLPISGARLRRDPRRVYFDLDGVYDPDDGEWVVPQARGQMIVIARELSADVSDEAFTLFRLRAQIPLQGLDYRDEFILNVGTEAVSFTKGCFLGQEPVAKVQHRSKPSRRLVVKYADECSAEELAGMTSRVVDPAVGREMGFVFVQNR